MNKEFICVNHDDLKARNFQDSLGRFLKFKYICEDINLYPPILSFSSYLHNQKYVAKEYRYVLKREENGEHKQYILVS